MKLYTEEQVKSLVHQCRIYNVPAERFLFNYTPIELPSDEEIEQEAHMKYPVNLQPNGRTLAGGKYDVDINYSERKGFMHCARWMRNKILNK